MRFHEYDNGLTPRANAVAAMSNRLLVGLCKKAFNEMEGQGGEPAAMALLAAGNELYPAFSIRADRYGWLGQFGERGEQMPLKLAEAAKSLRFSGLL